MVQNYNLVVKRIKIIKPWFVKIKKIILKIKDLFKKLHN